jgi:hypothetical protein
MSAPTCVDLQARFGRRYRVSFEASGVTRSQWPEADRAWLLEIRCRRGVVYSQGGDVLAAVTDRPLIGRRLRRLPCILSVRGDIETIVTFHVDDAPAVFAQLHPYRRRQVSTAERQRLAALSARHGFRKHGAAPRITDGDFSTSELTIGTTDGEPGENAPEGEP